MPSCRRILLVALLLAIATPAAAQQAPRYVVGGGFDPEAEQFVSGLHVMGGKLLPTRFDRVEGRIEGLLYTHSRFDGTQLLATGNLLFSALDEGAVRPYLLAGGGLHVGGPGVLAANLGVGTEARLRDRELFLEFRFHAYPTRSEPHAMLTLSLGTVL